MAPLNLEPTPEGNILIDEQAEEYRFAEVGAPGPLYTSHFSDCPSAGEWRR